MTSKIGFYRLQSGHIFIENYIVVKVAINEVTYSRKSVNTCGHNTTCIYYMSLFTEKQGRHMINMI